MRSSVLHWCLLLAIFLGPSLYGRNLVGLGSPIIGQEERRLSKVSDNQEYVLTIYSSFLLAGWGKHRREEKDEAGEAEEDD